MMDFDTSNCPTKLPVSSIKLLASSELTFQNHFVPKSLDKDLPVKL